MEEIWQVHLLDHGCLGSGEVRRPYYGDVPGVSLRHLQNGLQDVQNNLKDLFDRLVHRQVCLQSYEGNRVSLQNHTLAVLPSQDSVNREGD